MSAIFNDRIDSNILGENQDIDQQGKDTHFHISLAQAVFSEGVLTTTDLEASKSTCLQSIYSIEEIEVNDHEQHLYSEIPGVPQYIRYKSLVNENGVIAVWNYLKGFVYQVLHHWIPWLIKG